jgi:hypothetical protein
MRPQSGALRSWATAKELTRMATTNPDPPTPRLWSSLASTPSPDSRVA